MLSGADALVRMLQNAGIGQGFAYPGTSELVLCASASTLLGPLTNARGDKEAVLMAAGVNLKAPGSAIAILHGARGLTNALGAIADVRRSEISVLCVVGMASRASANYLPPHAEHRLIEHAAAFAGFGIDCSSIVGFDSASFCSYVNQALDALVRMPYGPVLLGVPQDLLSTAFVIPDVTGAVRSIPEGSTPNPDRVHTIVGVLKSAAHPVVLVDDLICRAVDAEKNLGVFSELISAPVLQVAYRRGPMLFQRIRKRVVPRYLGQYEPSNAEHRAMISAADLIVTVEDRNMYPRVIGNLPVCLTVALTSNREATLKNGYLRDPDMCLTGDVSDLLRQINQLLHTGSRSSLTSALSSGLQSHQASADGSAAAVVRAIGRGLSYLSEPIVIDDSQMLGGLIDRHYHFLPDSVQIFGSHGGFVGSGPGVGVGVALSNMDKPVLCLLGDQSFLNGVQALAVAGDRSAPIVFLICNNGASVSLLKQARSENLSIGREQERLLVNPARIDYIGIASGYGLTGTRLFWPLDGNATTLEIAIGKLTEAVAKALTARRPHVVELVLPGTAEFWHGVWNVGGHELVSN